MPSEGTYRQAAERLADSPDPSVRWRTRVAVFGESPASRSLRSVARAIESSARALALLSGRDAEGRILGGPYRKWQGPHWTLHCLALIGYPPGDKGLLPLREQVLSWLLGEGHLRPPSSLLIPGQEERFRRCASQEGNAVWYSLLLGFADARVGELAARLARWQWPDGGWNCDKAPQARASSVVESLIPLRGLGLASRLGAGAAVRTAAGKAGEYFLARRLHRRLRDGRPIAPAWGGPFGLIHHPIAFYDVLLALEAMAEIGKARDPRCAEALDMLEAKRLPDGGFPAEYRTAATTSDFTSRGTYADWGPMGRRRSNDLVTARALAVLRSAGRLGF